jgi:DNA-binding beta-propeller fold protein YncE
MMVAAMTGAPFLLALALTATASTTSRRLYVAEAKDISVYDIDAGHRPLRRIVIPEAGEYKGMVASPALQRLFLSSHAKDELISLDLATDKVVWRKTLGKYADSMAITPDGRTLYLPFRHEDCWRAIDAATGAVKATIAVGRGRRYEVDPIADIGPHNTWMNRAGTRVYLQVLTLPYVFIADTAKNTLIGKIGPFSKGVRPFVVTDDEKYVFASVDALLGFEVGQARTDRGWGGPMLRRIEAHAPPERVAQLSPPPRRKPHSTPSHGINIRPDQKEIWMVDGVYGYVYVYDITGAAPHPTVAIPLYREPKEQPHPGWISFGLDGRYAYPDDGPVIDTRSKKPVAYIPLSEKLIEIDFRDGKAVAAGHR